MGRGTAFKSDTTKHLWGERSRVGYGTWPYGGQNKVPPLSLSFPATTLEQGSDVRRRPQAQTIRYPPQGHGCLPPQTRGDPDLLRITLAAAMTICSRYIVFPGPLRIPVPNPTNVPNRCSLKPLTPETPEEPLLLVLTQQRLTLQVVCRSLPCFQLPKPSNCAR